MKDILKRHLDKILPIRLLGELKAEAEMSLLTAANAILPWRRKIVRNARGLRDLKVNIGCGSFRQAGWYCVDYKGETADLRLDIRREFPFANGSCRFIFSEHVFEHLTLEELRHVLQDCYRVLKQGGAIRIVVPDLERYVRAYVDGDDGFITSVWPTKVTPTEILNGLFYVLGHRFIHDFHSMSRELQAAGFSEVSRSKYRQSRFPELNIDSEYPHRQIESLYVEAIK